MSLQNASAGKEIPIETAARDFRFEVINFDNLLSDLNFDNLSEFEDQFAELKRKSKWCLDHVSLPIAEGQGIRSKLASASAKLSKCRADQANKAAALIAGKRV